MQSVRQQKPARLAAPEQRLVSTGVSVRFDVHDEPSLDQLRRARAVAVDDRSTIRADVPFRYMCDTPDLRQAAGNARLVRLSRFIASASGETLDTGASPLESVGQGAQRFLVRVKEVERGAVRVEGVGSRCDARVDLTRLCEPFVVYPGKVMGVEGVRICMEADIQATRLLSPSPLPCIAHADLEQAAAKRARVAAGEPVQRTSARSVVFMCGSYGETAPQAAAVLIEALSAADDRAVTAAFIIGPLLDEKGADKAQEGCQAEFEAVCDKLGDWFTQRSRGKPSDALMKVFMVPSPRDVSHDYVYPQPSYDVDIDPKGGDGPGGLGVVRQLPNPAVVSLEGVSVGVTSVDTLSHIGAVMAGDPSLGVKVPTPAGRAPPPVRRAAEEIVRSQSFYPLSPAVPGVPLEVAKQNLLEFPKGCTPQLLVLPSGRVPSFVETVQTDTADGSLVINPGPCRLHGGGLSFLEVRLGHGDAPCWRRATAEWFRSGAAPAP